MAAISELEPSLNQIVRIIRVGEQIVAGEQSTEHPKDTAASNKVELSAATDTAWINFLDKRTMRVFGGDVNSLGIQVTEDERKITIDLLAEQNPNYHVVKVGGQVGTPTGANWGSLYAQYDSIKAKK